MTNWVDNCDEDGYIYATWSAVGDGCEEEGVRPIPCESIVKLSFFNIYNIIAVIAVLIIIYYFYLKKKNNLKKKKSR